MGNNNDGSGGLPTMGEDTTGDIFDSYTVNEPISDVNEAVELIQNFKDMSISYVDLWFDDDYMVEINSRTNQPELYEFEPNTEHYNYLGEYPNLIEDLKKGHITYGRKNHKFIEMDVTS